MKIHKIREMWVMFITEYPCIHGTSKLCPTRSEVCVCSLQRVWIATDRTRCPCLWYRLLLECIRVRTAKYNQL